MAEVELECAVYGEGTVFPVKIALGAKVSALQEKIAGVLSTEQHIVPPRLLSLYLARKEDDAWLKDDDSLDALLQGEINTQYKKMRPSWKLSKKELLGPNFEPGEEEIHVLVELPDAAIGVAGTRRSLAQLEAEGTILESPHSPKRPALAIAWVQSTKKFPQLRYDGKPFLSIPWHYLENSGLKDLREGQDLCIYRRKALREQWDEMQRDSIDAAALLWIVGAPGAGKSCAAYAFACGLVDRTQWKVVLWIHFDRWGKLLCVKYEGDAKATCALPAEPEIVETLLTSFTGNHNSIVFLDGYTKESGCDSIVKKLTFWQSTKPLNHRLVCVTSMAATRYNLNEYSRLETSPTIPSRQNGAIPLFDQMEFQLSSWTLEEYIAAVAHENFFLSVMAAFDLETDPGVDGRQKVVKEKYFVAGGCARAMFAQSLASVQVNLKKAVMAVDDPQLYANCQVGGNSAGAVNRLIAHYDIGEDDSAEFQTAIVSGFALRQLAIKLGPAAIIKFSKCLDVNPAMDGHLFEAWVVASLKSHELAYRKKEVPGTLLNWEQRRQKEFDPTKDVITAVDCYFLPIKWNQAGYDAVYIVVDKATSRFRYIFLQITRATSHKFIPEPFVEVLHRLGMNKLNVVAVELWFVVPLRILDEFSPKVDSSSFQTNVVDVAFQESSRRDEPSVNVESRVAVVGVDYP